MKLVHEVNTAAADSTSFTAFLLGCLYGILVALAPDHLGTVMTLSAATGDKGAFRVGAVWGLGHAAGMGLILAFFFFIERVCGLSSEGWDVYGDYAVGLSMIACAAYFMARESHYVKENSDGTQMLASCSCCAYGSMPHSNAPSLSETKGKRGRGKHAKKFCNSFKQDGCNDCIDDSRNDMEAVVVPSSLTAESSPPVPPPRGTTEEHFFALTLRDLHGAILGIVQGFCCPMTFVGASFTQDINTMMRSLIFLLGFIFMSVVVTGVLAMGWSRLTRSGGSVLPPKVAYRTTCTFTLLLGAVWILASASGELEHLEWTKFDLMSRHQDAMEQSQSAVST